MSLGDRIIQLRTGQNMTQGQLAKEMDVSRQAVSKWESGLSTPEPSKLIRLAEVLDSDIEYLTTGRSSRVPIRPPVVLKTVETVEKIVEKPVVQVVERVVEVEKPVVQLVEKPVIKKVYRTKYVRNPAELMILGGLCFLAGLIIGLLL